MDVRRDNFDDAHVDLEHKIGIRLHPARSCLRLIEHAQLLACSAAGCTGCHRHLRQAGRGLPPR